jgi:1-deoxy-D-xylulose-5-phosphate synthase
MIVMAPSTENECRQMLFTAYQQNGPTAVRYPRGKGVGIEPQQQMKALQIGKGEVLREGQTIAILMFGSLLNEATYAAEELNATLVNMRFVKPIDEKLIEDIAASHDLLVTLEDNAIQGGAGSAVSEFLHKSDVSIPVLNLGIPDQYVEHATREEQLEEIQLDGAGIVKQVSEFNQGKYLELVKNAAKVGGCHLDSIKQA